MPFSRRYKFLFLFIYCIIGIYINSAAQTDQSVGNWNVLIFKGRISQRFSYLNEINIRSNSYNLKYDYFEIKGGLAYFFTPKLNGLIGAGIYDTFETGEFFNAPAKQKEFRTWLEMIYRTQYYRFSFDHRFRLEQRFIGAIYKNRFKYRLGLMFPLNKPKITTGSIYLYISDELFMPQYGVWVEKNRFYTGIGYKVNNSSSLQIGRTNDTDYKTDSHSIKDYVQVLFIWDLTHLFQKNHAGLLQNVQQ